MPSGFYDLNKGSDTFSFRFSHEYCIIYRIYCTALRDGGRTMERGDIINIVVLRCWKRHSPAQIGMRGQRRI